jgi:outer membrane receptor protein involved in Fe transport
MKRLWMFGLLLSSCLTAVAQTRTLQGEIANQRNEPVRGATVTITGSRPTLTAVTDGEGRFSLAIPNEPLTLKVSGKQISNNETLLDATTNQVRIEVSYTVPPIHDGMVISATQLDPTIERRNEAVYRDTLFSRDDQVFNALDAGINAGQHEGGGKSLEIRRFGFNLDHGGTNGGLKVLVDNVQQNQGTQGHGQGYLGQLKSLTPELVQDVSIVNGPFSAEYGDFSGLGVVHIRLKEALPDQFTARVQGGSFNTFRSFLAYSPNWKKTDALFAYEALRSDGPFVNPLNYGRDNVTGNAIYRLSETRKLGVKFNVGRNDFTSSGQLPTDEIFADRLDRFGFLDPHNGGRVRSGTGSLLFRQDFANGATLKADAFVARSLFDLWSNFTFFLNDPERGDEIQQHDSRLQQGANVQYLRPFRVFGQQALLNAGANYHDNQINVSLYNSESRAPYATASRANARVTNQAGYVQQGVDLLHGHLHVEAGLRFDYFRFNVKDRLVTEHSGTQAEARFQPKFNLAYTPTDRLPLTLYVNYGRGIASQDARGVAQKPNDAPKLSTTDFSQTGLSLNWRRFAVSGDLFFIDRSNEQVYIPDDGSLEFKDPSRAYGFEAKTSFAFTRRLSLNAGVTKVMNAFYRATLPRLYVTNAPRLVMNGGLTLNDWRGFTGSLRYRHISNYRLDENDAGLRASGLDVADFSLNKRLRRGLEFNLAIDNLTNKRYFETQNYFASRLTPTAEEVERIHATPGYGRAVTVGFTYRFGGK